jgi:hypothetical protein
LTPDSVDASAHWVQTEWQSYFSDQLSRGEATKRLIPLLVRRTEIPAVLRHIKYIDFSKESEFNDRFLELYNTLYNISDRPPLGMEDIETVRQRIRLARYQQAADEMAKLEEAASRLAGTSRDVIPGKTQQYPRNESVASFKQAFGKLQEISRDLATFTRDALAELQRTVAEIETMNLDFESDLIEPTERQTLIKVHKEYLEKNLTIWIGERNRAFCRHMASEFNVRNLAPKKGAPR